MACRASRATATRMRSRLPTMPLVGSNSTQPDPGKINLTPRMRRAAAEMALSRVATGHVEIAGDKAGGEAERPRGLHHQRRKIPAGAAPRRKRLQRGLRSPCGATFIGEPLLHRIGQGHQERARLGRTPLIDELSNPVVELAGMIGVVPLDRPGEVGHFLRVIGERIISGSVLEQEFRFVDRDMLERDACSRPRGAGFRRRSRQSQRNCRTRRESSEAGADGE